VFEPHLTHEAGDRSVRKVEQVLVNGDHRPPVTLDLYLHAYVEVDDVAGEGRQLAHLLL
jgi:hypothetical protein